MSNCIYDADPIDYVCIKSVVADVLEERINILTVRRLLKQIDSGLSTFGIPNMTPIGSVRDAKSVTLQIRALLPKGDKKISKEALEIIALLMELWTLLQPYLPR